MIVLSRFVSPPIETNAFIVSDSVSREAIVVDPCSIGNELLEEIAKRQLELKAIVVTHGHIDHTQDTALMVRRTGVPVYVHPGDAPMLANAVLSGAQMLGMTLEPVENVKLVNDGEEIPLGESKIRVIHAPGHSTGSICLWIGDDCLTGDVLFAGGVGRWDFPGGSLGTLKNSLKRLMTDLPGETRIHPGHGPSSTIAEERKTNDYIREWVKRLE
jgi:hydroxyacylglutathione hydrolase